MAYKNDKHKEYHRQYRENPENKARAKAYNAQYRSANRENMQRQTWAWKLWDKYGITAEDYWAMHDRQGGVCGVCRNENDNNRRLCVDHCHTTGKVRGLLCDRCNLALGRLGDDAYICYELANYLSRA